MLFRFISFAFGTVFIRRTNQVHGPIKRFAGRINAKPQMKDTNAFFFVLAVSPPVIYISETVTQTQIQYLTATALYRLALRLPSCVSSNHISEWKRCCQRYSISALFLCETASSKRYPLCVRTKKRRLSDWLSKYIADQLNGRCAIEHRLFRSDRLPVATINVNANLYCDTVIRKHR